MTQRPVVFFGQASVHVEPRERALDNPAPGVDAEIGFPHQYMRRFLDPDTVALGQVLAENAVKGTVHENDPGTAPSSSCVAVTSSQKAMAAAPSTA